MNETPVNNPFRIYNLLVSNFLFTSTSFVSKYIENVSKVDKYTN